MKNKKTINIGLVINSTLLIKKNEELENNKISALILEKICNECVITNEFLKSITLEDIEMARCKIGDGESSFIKELQKNTFLETIINKSKCLKTTNTEDFF